MGKITKKNNKKSNKKYNEELIQKALSEIKNGATKKSVAKKYQIPRSTLQFRLGAKFSKIRPGPNTYLTENEEKLLVEWILDSQKKGFPRRKIDLQISVKHFLDADRRPNPFKNNMPGDHWYRSFLNRHPILTLRTPEAVTNASSNVSENNIKKWFADIETYLKSKGYFSILEDPRRVYNGDETCFLFCPKLGKVLAAKSEKNVYEVDRGQAKQNLTVMFSFSASGDVTPPLIIFPNKRISKMLSDSVPDHWGIASTENGWMKSEVFIDYIKEVFYKNLVEQNILFPVILFVDGHKTHLTYELSKVCTQLQIILVALYPNSTRIMQPADVSCFKPLKTFWKYGVLSWRRENPYCQLGKHHFAPILDKAIKHLKRDSIVNGFKSSGLFPWNPEGIDYSKCLGKKEDKIEHQQKISSEKNIDYDSFCKMLNPDLLQELQCGDAVKNHGNCKYFNVLKNIYSELKPTSASNIPIVDNTTVEVEKEITNEYEIDVAEIEENILFSEEELLSMPVVFEISQMDNADEVPESAKLLEDQREETTKNYELNNIKKIKSPEKLESESLNDDVLYPSPPEKKKPKLIISQNIILKSANNKQLEAHESEDNVNPMPNQKNIADYLEKPKTPERSGKRTSTRTSFVLISSDYKRSLREKEEIKIEKEKKKEENKLKRQENAMEKEKKKKENELKKEENKQKREKKLQIKNESKDKGVKTLNTSSYSNMFLEASPSPQRNRNTQIARNEDNHVRKLFKTESYDEEETVKIDEAILRQNIIIKSGLCFICTYNITLINIGVKCSTCTRNYHYKCLVKHQIYHEHFVCKSCHLKNNTS